MKVFLLLLLLLCRASAGAQAAENGTGQGGPSTVVLVSLGGFRPDYAKRYGAHNLLAMATNGASAPEGMLPAYPSLTLPNAYTLMTGLYPEHHGIVANEFYDGARRFSAADPTLTADGSWYGGMPLWVLAERQGVRTACIGWPGSKAAIGGVRPSLSFPDEVPDAARVAQVLRWVHLPGAQQPRFIALYLADTDRAGRRFGPHAPQTRAAVLALDAQVGRLRAGLRGLTVDLIVVSDHGMMQTEGSSINLDAYVDLQGFETVGSLLYSKTEDDVQRVYSRLKIANAEFKVYRRANVPRELHYNANARIGDPVVIPNAPVVIRAHGPVAGGAEQPSDAGSDGYDSVQFGEMRAIFYAEGPDIRAGVKLKPFENVNVYPFVAELLGLDAPKTDGSAGVLSGVVR